MHGAAGSSDPLQPRWKWCHSKGETMKKSVMTMLAALGLLSGGIALGSFFSTSDLMNLFNAPGVPDLSVMEFKLKEAGAATQGASAAQVTQVHAELNTQMQMIQIKQNTEIIRLLSLIATKK